MEAMKAFFVSSLLISDLRVRGQKVPDRSYPADLPQVIPSTDSGRFSNLGAYSAEQICAQGPGMMQGQPVYQQGRGFFGSLNGQSDNPCIVTCQNQHMAWMAAKPHGAPCRLQNDPQGVRYCLNQVCVAHNASLNEYCRQALTINANSPDYMALMPYACTVACLDKATPSIFQVQFASGMTCHVNTPDGRVAQGYCINGACSTLAFRNQRGFFENLLDPRLGPYPIQHHNNQGVYPGSGYYNPFSGSLGGLLGGRKR